MLGAILASFGCILILILGKSNANTIAYAGRSALLSYSPARGEFPVKSFIGRGYFSYVDQNGNSNIVSFEPNPLLGVRVSASGQPLNENVLEKQAKANDDNRHQGELKPIKEFDETPFVDSVNQKDVNLPKDSLPSQSISKATDAEQQIFLYQLPEGAAAGRQAAFNPTNPFLPPIFADSSAPATVLPKPSVFPKPLGNGGQNPFLVGLSSNRPLVINPGAVPSSTSQTAFPDIFGGTSLDNVPPTTTSETVVPEILFPNSAGSGVFPPAAPFTTSAPPIFGILSTAIPDSTFPSQNNLTSIGTTIISLPAGSLIPGLGHPFLPSPVSVFPNPLPPSATPATTQGNPQNSLQPCTSPPILVQRPQFIANNKNPFLPQRTDLDSQASTLSPSQIEAITNDIDVKSSISGQAILSPPIADETEIPKQVTDTPEVEEAKREHFLAHQLALAQLELAEKMETSDKEHESSSPSLSVVDSSSAYLPPDVASFQAVTSGPSTVVITEQTKPTGAESVTVS